MDVLTPEQRRRCMQANKSRDTKPERIFARLLWSAGVRYRKQTRTIPGRPDFSIKRYKLAIFVDGDFWHGRDFDPEHNRFHRNRDFWIAKIQRNIERDQRVTAQLEARGWKVLRFWETDIKKAPGVCLRAVLDHLSSFTSLSAPAYLPSDLPSGTYPEPSPAPSIASSSSPAPSSISPALSPAPYSEESLPSRLAAEPPAPYSPSPENP